MTDETTPPSGSRWEPATGAVPASAPDRPAPVRPTSGEAGPTPARTAPARRWAAPGARRRGALVGAALGLMAASGLGGLALGHAAADGPGLQTGHVEQLQTSDDHPALPGGGAVSPGTLPGQPSGGGFGDDLAGDGVGGSDDDQGGSGTTQPGSPT